ncbi:MAG: hypothetical protein MI923_16410 [Phycisphaerales bacterium]|nr:hypothetical protein [Phycisphaerales bacterium]
MKKLVLLLMLSVTVGACGIGSLGTRRAGPVPVPGGVLIGLPSLEGQWVLADEFGGRFCLTIQESRISILNDGCRTDGLGFAARINDAPTAAIAGDQLIMTVAYNPEIFSNFEVRLTFTGELQADGSYVGLLRLEEPIPDQVAGASNGSAGDDADSIIVFEASAVLARV